MNIGAQSNPQLLREDRDWNIVVVGGHLALATYHAVQSQGISDADNRFAGMFDKRGISKRAYVRFKKDVIPRLNAYDDPFVRLVAVSREFRHEPTWPETWQDDTPLLFLSHVLTADLIEPCVERLDHLLDDLKLNDFELAEAASCTLFDVPEPPIPVAEEDDTSA